ncbi:hypothetical protein P5673_021702, partial [Acropora cervicornis]
MKRQHGGARKMAGREKSKPNIPFTGTEFTIKEVEDTLCKNFLGKPRDEALTSKKFHLMRALKGPLRNDIHLLRSSFYL